MNECFVLVILVLVAFTSTGVFGNTYCYQCNTYTDHSLLCRDPMDLSVPVISCDSDYVCTKVLYVIRENISITSRSCDLETSNTCKTIETTLRTQYGDLSSYNCTSCKTDYCNKSSGNSGVALVVSLITVLFGAVLVKILQ